MIKKLIMFSSLAGLLLTSCADEDLKPIATFEDSTIGIQAALIEGGNEEIDLANPTSASVTNTVMLRGDEAASYAIYVSYEDRNPDNGDDSKPEILYQEFGQSEFQTVAESPYPRVTYSITLPDLVREFGLNIDNLKAGDRFRVRTEIVSTDGRVFGAANSSAAVNGSAFSGYFNFNLVATCPLPDDKFTGTYALTYEGDATAGYGLPFPEGDVTVTVASGSTTKREFKVKSLPGAGNFPEVTAAFSIVCDVAVFEDTEQSANCGGPLVVGGGDPAPIISLSDDSVIRLNIVDYESDGNCGVPAADKVIILTKK